MIQTPPRALNPPNLRNRPDLPSPPNLTKKSRQRKEQSTTGRAQIKRKDKARVLQRRRIRSRRRISGRSAARAMTRPVSRVATTKGKSSSRRSPAANTLDTATTGSQVPRSRVTPVTTTGRGRRRSLATTGQARRRPHNHARNNQKARLSRTATMSRLRRAGRTKIPRASSEYCRSVRSFAGKRSCGPRTFWPASYSLSQP